MSKCPKCNKKIGAFYFKQNCPYCNANLMYYDFENRLNEDAALAEKEWDVVQKIIDGIKASTTGSFMPILRMVSFFLPVVALLMPTFNYNGSNVNLISIIKSIISSAGDVFGEKALMLCFISMAVAILFALVNLIVSLFSYTKNGLVRNVVFSSIGFLAFVGCSVAAAVSGASICNLGGFYVAALLMIATIALHIAVNNKVKNKNEAEEN